MGRRLRSGLPVILFAVSVAVVETATISAKSAPKNDSVALFVVATNGSAAQPCSRPRPAKMVEVASEMQAILRNKLHRDVALESYRTESDEPDSDILSHYLGASKKSVDVVLATVCRQFDVTSVSFVGYHIVNGAAKTSGNQSGTFDQLEVADPGSWNFLFGLQTPTPAPLGTFVPGVAFIPVGNDPNGVINPRLLHNLPFLTVIATPGPLGPATPGAAGAPPPAPTPPATRLAECQASSYKMLVVGRVFVSGANNDLSRAIVTAGSLSWTQPTDWHSYYTSLGVIGGFLYNPNSAEVSVDIFKCPPGAHNVTQVGGLGYHIVGHHTTPSFGTNPFAAQVAQDFALVDLENQIDCVVSQERVLMGVPLVSQVQLSQADDKATSLWCRGVDPRADPTFKQPTTPTSYFGALYAAHPDTIVNTPINAELMFNVLPQP
jgi:hypothetical protein